jgi:predicted O-methyltransferase YrrM
MIYDCFPFAWELDLLEIRLVELYPVVDRFVLVEATHTHKGDPKPLHFGEHRHRFAPWNDKIIHIVVGDLPTGEGLPAIRRREMGQRNAILRGLMDAKADDLVLISDLDEIPRREIIPELAQHVGDGDVLAFIQTLYYYNVNTSAPDRPWPGTRAARCADVWALSPHIIRTGIAQPDHYYPRILHVRGGGWHYSYFGGVEAIQRKQTQFLHQELVTEENTTAAAIERRVAKAEDIWGRQNEQQFVVGAAADLPTAIRCNPTKYADMFHPDWLPTFHEDWYAPELCDALGRLARAAPADGALVEIGCWEGRSTVALAQAVAPRVLHCVDHWQGSDGEACAETAQERDVYETWQTNIRRMTIGNVQFDRQDWRDWIADWERPIAFLHLDAAHDYDSVYDCLVAIKPFLVPGALLCGDDAYADGVYRATRAALGESVGEINARMWVWRNEG